MLDPVILTTPDPLRPVHALVFHESAPAEGSASGHERLSVITSHQVVATKNGPSLGAGQVLSVSDQERLMAILTDNINVGVQVLPEQVLYSSLQRLVWYVPGKVRTMYFRHGARLVRYRVPWPHLVFDASPQHLRLASVSSNARPRPDLPLYHAPLGNVSEDGAVCTGTAEVPNGVGTNTISGWESAVFDSAFSHVNQAHTLNLGLEGDVDNAAHASFWKGLATRKARRFPASALVPMNITLEQWLRDR